ncbi:MAG TPA: ABC transporter permease [Candidatus Acidoferrales bacterium]|nr:ABC transporter permease [Candidatus Acidoferrales bacterium]
MKVLFFGALALIGTAAVAMLIAGANPLAGFSALVTGALGGVPELAETLVQTTALLFPSLAVGFAFRAGLFNIGAEGQLVVGGFCAGLAGAQFGSAGAIAIPAILLAGACGGAFWGAVAGVIRARFGGNEVIATLMLNILALLLTGYLVSGPLRAADAATAQTATIVRAAWLPTILPDSRLTIAFPLAIALAFVLRYLFTQTVFGFELRAAGEAPEAARRAGVDLKNVALVAMTLSGALAGLGGATLVDGVLHRFNTEFSPGYGFIAIAVALVGNLDPLWIVVASFIFGILQSGALTMQALAHVPRDVVTFVEGLAIVGLAARRYLAARLAVARA